MEGTRIEISGTYRVPNVDPAAEDESPQIVREHFVIDREQPSGDEDGEQWTDKADDAEVVAEIDLQADDGEPVAIAARHLMDDPPEERTAPAPSEAPSGVLPLSQRIWQKARDRTQRNAQHREIARLDGDLRRREAARSQRELE